MFYQKNLWDTNVCAIKIDPKIGNARSWSYFSSDDAPIHPLRCNNAQHLWCFLFYSKYDLVLDSFFLFWHMFRFNSSNIALNHSFYFFDISFFDLFDIHRLSSAAAGAAAWDGGLPGNHPGTPGWCCRPCQSEEGVCGRPHAFKVLWICGQNVESHCRSKHNIDKPPKWRSIRMGSLTTRTIVSC